MFPIDGQPGLSSNTYKHHSLLISRHGNKIRNGFFRFEIQYGFQGNDPEIVPIGYVSLSVVPERRVVNIVDEVTGAGCCLYDAFYTMEKTGARLIPAS